MHTLAISRFFLPGEAQFPLNAMYSRPANRQEEGRWLHWDTSKVTLLQCSVTPQVTVVWWLVHLTAVWEVKMVAHTRLPSIGFRSWSRFLAVSLQVMSVINPTVGCHYFPPGLQLPCKPKEEGGYQFCCLVNRGTMGVNSLPKTVTRQRHDCDWNPGLLHLTPAC